jgi:hypothetical protein
VGAGAGAGAYVGVGAANDATLVVRLLMLALLCAPAMMAPLRPNLPLPASAASNKNGTSDRCLQWKGGIISAVAEFMVVRIRTEPLTGAYSGRQNAG